MKTPVRFAVRLPDGTEHAVSVLYMQSDGTVRRIVTHPLDEHHRIDSGWHAIQGDELEQVTLITYYPPEYGL